MTSTTPAPVRPAAYLPATADTFDWRQWLTRHPDRLLTSSEGRRLLTRLDPLLFALIYLRHHLSSAETRDRLTLADFHLDLCRYARQWARRDLGPAELRDAWVAPRGMGKSTWLFLILPLWALAHGHRRFVAAFADSTHQAQQHLASFKRELDTCELLRADFPDFVAPMIRPSGYTVADNQGLFLSRSGAAFQARGIDSSTLGAKIGNQRPDLLLFDDVEPDESNYSDYQKEKRLGTIVNAVFPMNTSAVVCMVGTTTMAGSIMHDVVRQITDADTSDRPTWPVEENIRTRYYPAILTAPDGGERSAWEARYPISYLLKIRRTRSFALNMMNDPRGRDGGYWTADDFTHGPLTPPATRWILQVDPAVTTTGKSDWTGLAVVGYRPPNREAFQAAVAAGMHREEATALHGHGYAELAYSQQVKMAGERLRREILRLCARFPRIKAVRVEVNQGGELWQSVLHDLPPGVKLLVHTVSEAKETRFAWALDYYQRGWVTHTERQATCEQQMIGFPNMAHDDVADAAVGGILYFLQPKPPPVKATATSSSYV